MIPWKWGSAPTPLVRALRALLIGCVALLALPAASASAQVRVQPLLFAHYYPWYDMNTWSSGVTPDLPSRLYQSADPGIMEQHVEQAVEAHIDAFNVAWLGPNNPTDANLAELLRVAGPRGLGVTLGFETDSPFMGSRGAVTRALRYALDTHTNHPSYVRIDGKPVLFFWRLGAVPIEAVGHPQTPGAGEGSAVAAWRAIRNEVDPNRASIWIAEGDRFEFLEVFDGIHPYSIAWSANPAGTLSTYGTRARQQEAAWGAQKLWVATVMPGYDDGSTGRPDAFSRDRRGGAYYDQTWAAALGSRPDWIMITSWNEWVEGSQIEPSRSYGNLYLDATQSYARGWKGILDSAPMAGGEELAELGAGG